MEFNLKKVLKALLFSTSEPLSIKDVQDVVTRYHKEAAKWKNESRDSEEVAAGSSDSGEQGVMDDVIDQVPSLLTATHIRDAMDEIQRDFEGAGDVTRLILGPKGYQIACAPEFADWVRLLRGDTRPTRLSRAALETLSVVSYRQPVTRAEIEAIRGVSADSAVNRLLEHELIRVIGRADLPGRPIQYGVTDKFLEFVGIKSVDELPASDVLSDRQLDDWLKEPDKKDVISDSDMGLAEEALVAVAEEETVEESSAEDVEENANLNS